MKYSNVQRLAVVVIAVAMALTACGASPAAAPPQAETGAGPADPTAAAPTTESAPSDDAESAAGLDDYLGTMGALIRGRGDFSEEQFEAENQLIEREVQLCMQEAGFEYTPGEAGGTFFIASTGDQAGTEKEQAERNGFGISTSFDEMINLDIDFEPPTSNPFTDMDTAEIDARNRALWGEDALRFDAVGSDDGSSSVMTEAPLGLGAGVGGCKGDAEAKIRGDVEALSAISSQLDELDKRIAADPRVAQIGRDWAACMRTAGFTYETRDEALDDIQARFEPFLQTFFTSVMVFAEDGEPDLSSSGFGGNELTDAQEQELAELQDHERAVATASLECEGDSRDVLEAIDTEYEAAFVEENRSLLEALSS